MEKKTRKFHDKKEKNSKQKLKKISEKN